jgi:hypothetical protein
VLSSQESKFVLYAETDTISRKQPKQNHRLLLLVLRFVFFVFGFSSPGTKRQQLVFAVWWKISMVSGIPSSLQQFILVFLLLVG